MILCMTSALLISFSAASMIAVYVYKKGGGGELLEKMSEDAVADNSTHHETN